MRKLSMRVTPVTIAVFQWKRPDLYSRVMRLPLEGGLKAL